MNYQTCFAAYLRRQGRKPATVKSYTGSLVDFKLYCRRRGPRKSVLKDLQPLQLEAYKEYLLNTRGLRPSTVNRRLAGLSAFARFLLGRGLLGCNPLELVARVRSSGILAAQPRAAWKDIQKFRQEVNRDVIDLPGRIIVELLYTGLTVRELCSLRWDGQTAAASIKVGKRIIQLHPEAQLAFNHYMILRPILEGGYLIVGDGADWSLKTKEVYSVMRRVSKRTGSRVSVRDLRLAQFAQQQSGYIAPAYTEQEKTAA